MFSNMQEVHKNKENFDMAHKLEEVDNCATQYNKSTLFSASLPCCSLELTDLLPLFLFFLLCLKK